MGRIKSTLIKRTSRQLLQEKDVFSEDFDQNKRAIGNTMPSKKTRNKIAGYVSRLVKMRRLQAEEEVKRKEKRAIELKAQIQQQD